jgi:hypothetical protein
MVAFASGFLVGAATMFYCMKEKIGFARTIDKNGEESPKQQEQSSPLEDTPENNIIDHIASPIKTAGRKQKVQRKSIESPCAAIRAAGSPLPKKDRRKYPDPIFIRGSPKDPMGISDAIRQLQSEGKFNLLLSPSDNAVGILGSLLSSPDLDDPARAAIAYALSVLKSDSAQAAVPIGLQSPLGRQCPSTPDALAASRRSSVGEGVVLDWLVSCYTPTPHSPQVPHAQQRARALPRAARRARLQSAGGQAAALPAPRSPPHTPRRRGPSARHSCTLSPLSLSLKRAALLRDTRARARLLRPRCRARQAPTGGYIYK